MSVNKEVKHDNVHTGLPDHNGPGTEPDDDAEGKPPPADKPRNDDVPAVMSSMADRSDKQVAGSGTQEGTKGPEAGKSEEGDSVSKLKEELQKSNQNVRLLQGKLKGYETLGEMYNEMRRQCVMYKQSSELLQNQMQALLANVSATDDVLEHLRKSGMIPQSTLPKATAAVENEEVAVGKGTGEQKLTEAALQHSDPKTSSAGSAFVTEKDQTKVSSEINDLRENVVQENETTEAQKTSQEESGQVSSDKSSEKNPVTGDKRPTDAPEENAGDTDTVTLTEQEPVKDNVQGEDLTKTEEAFNIVQHSESGAKSKVSTSSSDKLKDYSMISNISSLPGSSFSSLPSSSFAGSSMSWDPSLMGTRNFTLSDPTFTDSMTDKRHRRKTPPKGLSSSPPSSTSKISNTYLNARAVAERGPPSNPPAPRAEVAAAQDEPSLTADMSLRLQQFENFLRQFEGPPSSSDFVAEVMNFVPKVIRVEKQIRMKQILIDNLTQENAILRQQCADDKNQIGHLQEHNRQETARLMEQMRQLEALSHSSSGNSDGQEWHVDRKKSSKKYDDLDTFQYQQKKIKKLQVHIQKMAHTKEVREEEHEKEKKKLTDTITALKADVQKGKDRLLQYHQTDQKRQREINSVLASAKQTSEQMELTKRELKQRADEERKQRVHWESQCTRELRRTQDLQQRIEELQNQCDKQADIVQRLSTQNRNLKLQAVGLMQSIPSGTSTNSTGDNAESLATELQLLRQQREIWQKDFHEERRDRERAQSEKAQLEEQMRENHLEFSHCQDELRRTKEQLSAVQTEKQAVEEMLAKKSADVRRLQESIQLWEEKWHGLRQQLSGSVPSSVPTGPPLHPPWQPVPLEVLPSFQQPVTWPCPRCTYENFPERLRCEMCGAKAPQLRTPGVRITSTTVPATVEHHNIEPCQQHLISRQGSRYGRLECDERSPALVHVRVGEYPSNDVVVDHGSDTDSETSRR